MKIDNFVLLIISIVTLIVISLLTECNRGRLTELENKATKEIVETFFHLGSADPTEPGQKGYLITRITEGKYGGRSRQEVLYNIGGHNQGEYITESEKQQYDSDLFDSTISGTEKNPVHCTPPSLMDLTEDNDVYCEDICVDNKLTYKYFDYVPAEYGGTCNMTDIIIDNNDTYKYITEDNENIYESRCLKTEGEYNIRHSSSLLQITVNIDNTITIVEPTWCGFFSSEEVSEELFNNKSKLSNATSNSLELLEIANLYDKQFAITHSRNAASSEDIYTNFNFKKYTIDDKYYNVIYKKIIFTNCGRSGNNGPTQPNCKNEYKNKYGNILERVESGKQIWIVPKTGQYKITTIGADGGGRNGGKGYLMSANFNLNKNEQIVMMIGQKGGSGSYSHLAGGGGGGTFVLDNNNNPIIISGGGGGGSGGSSVPPSGGDGILPSGGDAGGDGGGGGIGGGGGGGGGFSSGGGVGNNGRPLFGDNTIRGGGGGGGFSSGGGVGGDGGTETGPGGQTSGGDGGGGGFGGGGGGGAGYQGGGGGGGGYNGGNGATNNLLSESLIEYVTRPLSDFSGGRGGSSYVSYNIGGIIDSRVVDSLGNDDTSTYSLDGNGRVIIEYIPPQIGSA